MCTDFGRRFPAALTLTGAEAVAIIPNGTALVSYATIIDWFPVVIVAGAANSGGAGFRTVNIPNRAAFSARDRQAGRRLGHQLRADRPRSAPSTQSRTLDRCRRGAICKDLRDLRSPLPQLPPFRARVRGCRSLEW
jgi:hypothetical protein